LILLSASQPQADVTVGISTLNIWVKIPQGKTMKGQLHVKNYQSQPKRMVVQYVDWKRLENGENVFLPPNSVENSLEPWLTFKPQEKVVQPGKTLTIKYQVDMPEDAQGSLWGALILRTVTPGKENEESGEEKEGDKFPLTDLYKGIPVKILVVDPATAEFRAAIEELTSIKEQKAFGKLDHFKVTFKNRGNVPLHPRGKIEIFDSKEKKVEEVRIKKFNVLPGGKITVKIPYEGNPLPPGQYRVVGTLSYGELKESKKEGQFRIIEEQEEKEERAQTASQTP